jgi:hypothetical protein
MLGIDLGKITEDIRFAVREDTAEFTERLDDIFTALCRTNELLEQLVVQGKPCLQSGGPR